mgnify:FL=1
MTNKDYYFLSKLAKAEKTIKQATVTTCTHKALTPTEPVAPTLGESDKIMYGQGSVAKNASDDDRSGAITDAVIDRIYSNIPGVNALHGTGALLGASGFGSDRSPNASAASLIPGVAGYNTVQHRRQVDRLRSDGKRDRSVQLHELAGSITNNLLLALLGAGAGAGIGYLYGRDKYISNRFRMRSLWTGAALGGIGGAGAGLLTQGTGGLLGLLAANKKGREEYLKNGGMWKNYLIPGYAGYQAGAGLSDATANS